MNERHLPKGRDRRCEDTERITIVLAEEQSELRRKLRLLLDSEPDLQVVGEVNNGLDALDMVGNLHPEILVLGLNASNNQEIIRLVNLRYPLTAVIIPYKVKNEDREMELLATGVKAYILKKSAETELAEAIRYVNASKNMLSPPAFGSAPQHLTQKRAEYLHDPIETLTAREREIFELVVHELTNIQIAKRLSISRRTVEIHRANILRKLGLRNQHQQLLTYAIERGILSQ